MPPSPVITVTCVPEIGPVNSTPEDSSGSRSPSSSAVRIPTVPSASRPSPFTDAPWITASPFTERSSVNVRPLSSPITVRSPFTVPFCFSFTAISVSRPEVARLTSSAASTVIRSKAFPCDPIDSSRPAPRSTAPSFDATVKSEPRRPPSPVVTDCITSPLAVSVTEASFSSVVSSPTVTAPTPPSVPVSFASVSATSPVVAVIVTSPAAPVSSVPTVTARFSAVRF